MDIIEYKYKDKLTLLPSVLALGFFDGVTIAHRELISIAKKEAQERKIPLGVFTFYSENSLKPTAKRIYSTEEKLILFERCGVDFTVIANFESLAKCTHQDFVKEILIGDIHAECAVAGYNFHFGYGALGNAQDLALLMKEQGKAAILVKEQSYLGDTVSSTLIRKALLSGDIEKANALLGAPYFLRGRVEFGKGMGRSLGFPTVNTPIENWRITPLGVFRSAVIIDKKIYHALTNIGSCPTLGEREVHAETHILGFSGNLYGRDIEIYLLGFLREERRFSDGDSLMAQVEQDKINAIKENGELTWQKLGLK